MGIVVVVPLCANMMSSSEPEVNDILQCCYMRTEPRSLATCQKFGEVTDTWFLRYACRQTDIFSISAIICSSTGTQISVVAPV